MTPNRLTAIAFQWSISAVFTLWLFAPHAQAQSAAIVALSVCDAGKVDIDVFVAKEGKVSSSHIGAADCARVYSENRGSASLRGIGRCVDSRGQWGTARRLDLLPDFGGDVLTRADKNVSVRRGTRRFPLNCNCCSGLVTPHAAALLHRTLRRTIFLLTRPAPNGSSRSNKIRTWI